MQQKVVMSVDAGDGIACNPCPPSSFPARAGGLWRKQQMANKTHQPVGYGDWGRVELTTLTKEFFMPRFLERDEAIRREPRAPYAWDRPVLRSWPNCVIEEP